MDKALLEKLYLIRDLYSVWQIHSKIKTKIDSEIVEIENEYRINNDQDHHNDLVINQIGEDVDIKGRTQNFMELVGLIFLIPFGIVLACFLFVVLGGLFTARWDDNAVFRLKLYGFIAAGLVIAFFIIFVCYSINLSNQSKKYRKLYNETYDSVKKSNDERNSQLAEKRDEFLRLARIKDDEINRLSEAYEHVLHIGYVYISYANIEAVCQFIQYLESGRCETLEGQNGCYNLYEIEKRQNLILTGLNSILKQLELIKNNQYVLYDTLVTINEKVDFISQKIENLGSTTIIVNDVVSGAMELSLSSIEHDVSVLRANLTKF